MSAAAPALVKPSNRKQWLTAIDHQILIGLIRGRSVGEIALSMAVTQGAISERLGRMKDVMECRTTYQLVALEVVNLMCEEDGLRVAGICA